MKPSERYFEITRQTGFVEDTEQSIAVQLLDELYCQILAGETYRSNSWWAKLLKLTTPKPKVKGLYFWGGVGRGKTFLMDIFYQCLPEQKRMRVHFHDFMNQIHRALNQKESAQNPLRSIAADLAKKVDIICLDEFVIIDIGDAMIMAGLLEALFEASVTLVTTSNAAPQNLYRDGLQRARFLPAIDLISRHCRVVNIDGSEDYRLRGLQQTHLYTVPHSQKAEQAIQQFLDENPARAQTKNAKLQVNGREIGFQVCAEDIIWFKFDELCKTARSQDDYLEIAKLFNTLIVTDIEIMTSDQDDIARRFVLMVDVIYDHRVKLICTAAADANKLYQGKRLSFEFERTASRLTEMQSSHYLGLAHTQQ